MKKQVESQEVTTVQNTVTICDKCGLEATDSRELYRDLESVVHDNTLSESPVPYAMHYAQYHDHTKRMVRAVEIDIEPGHAVFEWARDDEPDVELCADCYDEILGWRDD